MTQRDTPILAGLPLWVAYVLAPFAVLAGKLSGKPDAFRHFTLFGMAPWMLLAGLALAICLGQAVLSRSRLGKSIRPALAVILLLAAALAYALRAILPTLAEAQQLAPLLAECKLPALALFAGLWAWTFGTADRTLLTRLGAALGVMVTLDFCLTAILAKRLVLGGGALFGQGSAGMDALALLLCIALCAALEKAAEAPERPSPALWCIMAGLLAGFSKPGLVIAAALWLFVARGALRERLAVTCGCALVLWLSLRLPLPRLEFGRESLGLGWHYTAVFEALRQDVRLWFTGLPLDSPLAMAVPDETQDFAWDPEDMGINISVFEVPASLLRLLAGWGVGGPLLVLAGLVGCVLHGKRRLGWGLLLTAVLAGLLTPILSIPATTGALCLALAMAFRPLPAQDAGQ